MALTALAVVENRPRLVYLVPDRRVARASHAPSGRALHLLDVENLIGGPWRGRAALRCTAAAYAAVMPVRLHDLVIVGAGVALAVEAGLAWPKARLVVGRGPDGADHALLREVGDVEWVAARFDRVVIGSGDGIFTAAAERFRAVGVAVEVVGRERSVSYSLARVAHLLRFVPDTPCLELVT